MNLKSYRLGDRVEPLGHGMDPAITEKHALSSFALLLSSVAKVNTPGSADWLVIKYEPRQPLRFSPIAAK